MNGLVRSLLFLLFLAGIVLYAAGAFRGDLVRPGRAAEPAAEDAPPGTAKAERVAVPVHEDAVATVESRVRVVVSAQVQARVAEVRAEAGSPVEARVPVVLLDDRELVARRAQAAEALAQAEAAVHLARQAKARAEAVLTQTRKRYERSKGLLESGVTTPEQFEEAEAGWLQAQASVAEADAAIAAAGARVEQAKQFVTEADVAKGYATIAAPITGVVALKAVEPGDIAWPGKTLLELIDPEALRVEAQVREGLIRHVEKGVEYEVEVPAAGKVLRGQVAEICPTADPLTRTFRVRVDIDAESGVRPGMFGRLRIPVGPREIVRIPAATVTRTGQLTTVRVDEAGRTSRRAVTLGRDLGDGFVEVLSGLAGGETLRRPESGLSESGR
jgi:RND family efflux transporter MFP subunit